MMLLIGQSISLIPDKTAVWQFLIFMAVMVILTIFVFRPTLKILEKRREQTADLSNRADQLIADAIKMDKEYTDEMEVAKKEGAATEQELIRQGEEEARAVITNARNEAQQTMLNWRGQLKTEGAETQQRLQHNIDEFAQMIINKILGRGSH